MTQSLAVRYRPTSFDQMVGQRLSAMVLSQMVAQERVPSGLLFSGPSGTGKTTAARILAHGLDPDVDPSLSVVEIDAASHGGVADVRSLTESLRYSTGGKWRTVILDEAQALTRDAFNALLKTLEEPPPGTVFVLVTTEPNKIPETVVSRLLEFEFRLVSAAEIFDRLVQISGAESMEVSTDLLEHLAQTCQGSVRRAVMDLEKANLAQIRTADQWIDVTAARDYAPQVLIALFDGRTADAFALVDLVLSTVGHPSVLTAALVHCLRDVLVIKAGGKPVASADGLEARKLLAARITNDRLVGAIRLLWDLRTKIRQSDDARGALDLAVALLGEIFTRGRLTVAEAPAPALPVQLPTIPAKTPEEPVRRLSLAEMTV